MLNAGEAETERSLELIGQLFLLQCELQSSPETVSKCKRKELGMAAHASNPVSQRQRWMDLSEFEATVIYITSFRHVLEKKKIMMEEDS